MRRFRLLAALVVFVTASDPDAGSVRVASAAPIAAQRGELSTIRRELAKVPGLLRRRMGDEARKTVEAAEGRLKKLLDAAPGLARDRSVLFIKRLLEAEKLRVRKAVGKGTAKTPVANAPGSPRRKVTIPVGGKKSPLLLRYEAQQKAERERAQRDLEYWTRIAGSAKPQAAMERERALFHVGVTNIGLKRWKEAKGAFETLVKEFPSGPWAISARCRLVDLTVEHDLDFEAGNKELASLFKWAIAKDQAWLRAEYLKKKAQQEKAKGKSKSKDAKKSKDVRAKPASGVREPVKKPVPKKVEVTKSSSGSLTRKDAAGKPVVPSEIIPTPTDERRVAEVYWRYGVVRFVQGGVAYAKSTLPRAAQLAGRPAQPGTRMTGDEQARMAVLAQAMRNRLLTPLPLAISKKATYPYVAFGDVLYHTRDYERARDYATAVLARKGSDLTGLQKSYVHYLRGRCYNGIADRKERSRAPADFLAAQKIDPKAPWADFCLFLAANARWNHEQHGTQAIALWQRLMKEYPKSREWDRSAYYVGVVHQQEKRYADAKAAYDLLLQERPKTAFAKLTKEQLKKVDREMTRGTRR